MSEQLPFTDLATIPEAPPRAELNWQDLVKVSEHIKWTASGLFWLSSLFYIITGTHNKCRYKFPYLQIVKIRLIKML